ncbi:hypothetical protein QYM36_008230 [Artemia franciscana]|uniref:Uncharacterized protein n=1 Tax=Artemia franciscana TaxID=6661 RepID=A0AA88IFD8_ARTSF|nr:hypothetical protein QYM36_008230 [Artemia franciscana]
MQQTLVQNPLAAQRLENDAFVSSFSGHFKAALRIAEETSNVPEEGAINKVMALLMKKKEKLTPEQVLSRLVRDRKARGKDSFNPVGSGDMNASISSESCLDDFAVGPVTVDSLKDNGERMLNCCLAHNLTIANTWSQRPNIAKYTWYSNNGSTKKMLDYIIICR